MSEKPANKCFIFALILFAIPLRAQTFSDFLIRANTTSGSEKIAVIDSFMNTVVRFPYVENDTLVHFVYRGTAYRVNVPGDANGWNPSAFPMSQIPGTDFWYRSEAFEPDARLDYKFVLNGTSWILDPRNPFQVLGGFGPNSELRMPGYEPPPEIEYDPEIPHGTLIDTTFFSRNLGNARKIRIYLPPDYERTGTRYPLILFNDGLEYISLANANNVIDYLIANNRIVPIIGVFIPPVNRTAEYAGNLKNKFAAFALDEILPWVDSRFRTDANSESRAVMGASNGGNISLWLALKHPEAFRHVAAQSSNIETQISLAFQNTAKLNLNFYLDIGTYDIPLLISRVKNFIPILKSKGYKYAFKEFHEGHSWGNWRAHIDDALEFFFPAQTTSIRQDERRTSSFRILQNYPNPFNQHTKIQYSLSQNAHLSIVIYNILGQKVSTLVDQQVSTGQYTVIWNGKNQVNEIMPGGIYLFRVQVNGHVVKTGRIILLPK